MTQVRKYKVLLIDVVLINLTTISFFQYSLKGNVDSAFYSYLRWAILGIWILSLAYRLVHVKFQRHRYSTSGIIALLMLSWFTLSLIKSNDLSYSLTRLAAIFALYVLGYVLIPNYYRDGSIRKAFLMSLFVGAIIFLYFGFKEHTQSLVANFGSVRMDGEFHRAGYPAYMGVIILYVSIAVLMSNIRKSFVLRVLLLSLMVLALVTIYITGVRTAFFSVILIITTWLILIKRYRFSIAMAALTVMLIILPQDIEKWYMGQGVFSRPGADLLTGRTVRYQYAMDVFSENPLLGIGFNSEHRNFEGFSAYESFHSGYISALVETGILGFLLFVAFVISSIGESLRNALRYRDDWVVQFQFLFVATMALHSTVELGLYGAGNILILTFYILMGSQPPLERGGAHRRICYPRPNNKKSSRLSAV